VAAAVLPVVLLGRLLLLPSVVLLGPASPLLLLLWLVQALPVATPAAAVGPSSLRWLLSSCSRKPSPVMAMPEGL
jgi:hypothetical protein